MIVVRLTRISHESVVDLLCDICVLRRIALRWREVLSSTGFSLCSVDCRNSNQTGCVGLTPQPQMRTFGSQYRVTYRPTSSSKFFLCFGGFRRLSGMTRPAGGGPAISRARRRASRPAVNFEGLRLLLAMIFTILHLGILESVPSLSSR